MVIPIPMTALVAQHIGCRSSFEKVGLTRADVPPVDIGFAVLISGQLIAEYPAVGTVGIIGANGRVDLTMSIRGSEGSRFFMLVDHSLPLTVPEAIGVIVRPSDTVEAGCLFNQTDMRELHAVSRSISLAARYISRNIVGTLQAGSTQRMS